MPVKVWWFRWKSILLPFEFNREAWPFFRTCSLFKQDSFPDNRVLWTNENVSFGAWNYACLSKQTLHVLFTWCAGLTKLKTICQVCAEHWAIHILQKIAKLLEPRGKKMTDRIWVFDLLTRPFGGHMYWYSVSLIEETSQAKGLLPLHIFDLTTRSVDIFLFHGCMF